MTEELTIHTKRVDDFPLLIAKEERMGVAQLMDEAFVPHGNWQGLSPGDDSDMGGAHSFGSRPLFKSCPALGGKSIGNLSDLPGKTGNGSGLHQRSIVAVADCFQGRQALVPVEAALN